MKNELKKLIAKYEERCDSIIRDSGAVMTDDGLLFNYDCDADDQIMSAELESEYYTFLAVIEDLKEIIKEI